MTSNDPSYQEMLTFLVLFISPEDSFMDSGTVQQCVPGVWLGEVHTGVPFCKDPVGAHAGRGLQASGVSHHMGKKLGPAGAPVGIWARPEEEVVCGVSSIVPGLGCFNLGGEGRDPLI